MGNIYVNFILPVLNSDGKSVEMRKSHAMWACPVVGMGITVNRYRTKVESVSYDVDNNKITVRLAPDMTLLDAHEMGYGCPCLDNILQNWRAAGWEVISNEVAGKVLP